MNEQLAQFGGISGVLLAVGWFLKNQTPINNRWIPTILAAVGVIVSITLQGPTVGAGIEGLMAAMMAVGFHAGARSTVSEPPKPPTT